MHGGNIYSHKIEYDFSVNLNPFMPDDTVLKAFRGCETVIGKYPETDSKRLIRKIAAKLSENKSSEVFEKMITVTAGASEAISVIANAVRPDVGVIFEPAFSGYERALTGHGTKELMHLLTLNEYIKTNACENDKDKTGIVFLASPSNPSGIMTSKEDIKEVYRKCVNNHSFLVLDECFINLSNHPENTMVAEAASAPEYYRNLIILRSFTKTYSIPGIRLGYIICTNELINDHIRNLLPEWNISSVACEVGAACLDAEPGVTEDYLVSEKEYMYSELDKLNIKYHKSDSIYFLIESDKRLYEELLKKRILIRDCSDYYGLSNGTYRIAVKTRKENEILIKAIGEIYGK